MFRYVLLTTLALAGAARAEPLTFGEALALAERGAPRITAADERLAAARAEAIPATALPDPKLMVGLENLPTSGPDRFSPDGDFMTMQKLGFSQDIPNAAKRRARAAVAQAAIDTAEAERRVKHQEARRDAAVAWVMRYHLEQRAVMFDRLDDENAVFAAAVNAALGAGKGTAADAVAPRQEAAEIADRRDELAGQVALARAELTRVTGAPAERPLEGAPPPATIDAGRLREHLYHHPELAAFGPMSELAAAEVREAEAMKHPDWNVELAYQRRGPAYSDMVSVALSVDLPFFTAKRQDPRIAAKQHALAEVDASRAAMLRDHAAELERDLAEYEARARQLGRLTATKLPLAREKVELATASYAAGKLDLMAVVTARRELIETEITESKMRTEQAALAAKLQFTYVENEP
ncbi:MAG: TolC family protein [Gammaproteobacteria bacterium]|nr:TolC family protein [Gammaproteobacteria bacterium]MBI5616862.1 TolC family protein [Gammaproteobacteria bacterium]